MPADRLVATVAGWLLAEALALPPGELGAWLVAQIEPSLPAGLRPEMTGVYLATPDAGAEASLAFWREALAAGVGFANPHLFPWTLASSPASHIALALGCRGPNVTLVGGAGAAVAALQQAVADLQRGRIEAALAGALATRGETRLALLWLAAGAATAGPRLTWEPAGATGDEGTAVALFAQLVGNLENGTPAVVGAPYEGVVRVER
jgi:3-oxoacyl-(acyl-carrier-protein) synthase